MKKLQGSLQLRPSALCVQTARGKIEVQALGDCLVHEHIFWEYAPKWRERSIEFSRRELAALYASGGRTVVDVAPHPYRIPEWYQELASQTEIQIIVSTGFYLENRTNPAIRAMNVDEMVECFVKEATVGIGDSELKAGVIKVAGERAELTPWEKNVLRAAARVQRMLGIPICAHAIEGWLLQFHTLLQAGANPEMVYICHTETESGWEGRDVEGQLAYLEQITREGGSLFFSNFGWEFLSQEKNLKRLVLELCERGYRERLLIGADANYKVDSEGNTWWEEQKNHPELPHKNFAYTYTYTVQLLKSWGLSAEDLDVLLVQNPGRLFGGQQKH
jgi:predicted metal-dependent phosphotriesterase family hydrolase